MLIGIFLCFSVFQKRPQANLQGAATSTEGEEEEEETFVGPYEC